MMTRERDFYQLQRDGIESLDRALYCASCFAASAADGSRTVTILLHIEGVDEVYRIEDGRVGPVRDNVTGWDWTPSYYVEAPVRG